MKGIFADDPDPMLEEAKTMRKAKDNLAQSYDYFIKRHEKAKDNEEKNKVRNGDAALIMKIVIVTAVELFYQTPTIKLSGVECSP